MKNLRLVIAIVIVLTALFIGGSSQGQQYNEWRMFGGGPENIHYSTLSQINRDNLDQLEVAWTYDSGDAFPSSEMQCNPIIIDGVLYATTPKLRVIALNAENGKLIYRTNPQRLFKLLVNK